MDIKERFQKIVGEKFVADGSAERYIYSHDMTENPPCEPLLIVMPDTVEEIQDIVKLANACAVFLVTSVMCVFQLS